MRLHLLRLSSFLLLNAGKLMYGRPLGDREEYLMEISAEERRALVMLLRLEEMERASEIVSKTREGVVLYETLLKELGDISRIELGFSAGPSQELKELLAEPAVHAKVLSDVCGVNLLEAFESAAEKIRKKGVIPRLSYREVSAVSFEPA